MRDGEQQANSTSGQVGPKSKFRETSNTPAPSDRLQQGADSSGFTTRRDKKSAYRAERTGAKPVSYTHLDVYKRQGQNG